MSSVAVAYLIIKVFEILVIILCGIKISKLPENFSSLKYWKIAFWAVSAYAIGEGLRWGHQIDYNGGWFIYNEIQGFLDDKRNPLWSIISYSFKLVGINYNFFIFFQCAFLMYSILVLVKDYHRYAAFILPLSIIGILTNENFVRWYTAFSFVLIGLHYYVNKKDIKAVLFFILAVLTHFAYFLFIWLFLLFKLLNRIEFKPWLVSLLFVVVNFFGDVSWIAQAMNELSLLLIRLGLTEDINQGFIYIGSTEQLLKGEVSSGITESSLSLKLVRLLINVPILLWSKKYVNNAIPHFNAYYNLYALGIIIGPIFKMVTLLGRMIDIWAFFFCIVGGVFYSIIIKYKKLPQLVVTTSILGMLLYFYPYIKAPFSRADQDMYFLWDSNGQEYNNRYK